LLILDGESHAEECLDAGVQVEPFTGPAGPDRRSVGMVEAGHRRKLHGVAFPLPVQLLAEQGGSSSALYQGRCGLPSGITNTQPARSPVLGRMVMPPSSIAV
jgi:hypothetical protein